MTRHINLRTRGPLRSKRAEKSANTAREAQESAVAAAAQLTTALTRSDFDAAYRQLEDGGNAQPLFWRIVEGGSLPDAVACLPGQVRPATRSPSHYSARLLI